MNADGSEPIANIVVNAEDALKVHVPIRARHDQAPDRLGTVGLCFAFLRRTGKVDCLAMCMRATIRTGI